MPKILLLEDDFLIAYDLKAQLEDAGMEVVGPVASNEDAEALIAPGAIHAAVLDMDLGGVPSFPTAHRLQEFGIPFVFVTGNDQADLQDGLANSPVHTKPVHFPRLIDQLRAFATPD
jgi:DNA-binding response OmpR family regulator